MRLFIQLLLNCPGWECHLLPAVLQLIKTCFTSKEDIIFNSILQMETMTVKGWVTCPGFQWYKWWELGNKPKSIYSKTQFVTVLCFINELDETQGWSCGTGYMSFIAYAFTLVCKGRDRVHEVQYTIGPDSFLLPVLGAYFPAFLTWVWPHDLLWAIEWVRIDGFHW